MLLHSWNAAVNDEEWRNWIADGHDFGQLIAVDPDRHPVVAPAHFVLDDDCALLHLGRPNPVWRALEHDPRCMLTVIGNHAYIPGPWRVTGDTPAEHGVPTSYYASVQLSGVAEIVDDPDTKVALLRRQLAHFQPEGGTAQVSTSDAPFARMLAGLRGVVLHVHNVTAQFKYDDQKPVEMQRTVARRLRDRGDESVAAQQLRRLGQRD